MSRIEDILGLLEEEHRALASGDLAALEPLLKRKEVLAEGLSDMKGGDARSLRRALDLSTRNGDLFSAAQLGLARAERQIRGLRTGMAQATYDRDGSRRPMSRMPGRVEHKL